MPNHYAHYLKRIVRIRFTKEEKDLFYNQEQSIEDGFDTPMFHVTKQKRGPANRIKEGDIIWLFSVLQSPWDSTPPSLDAKIMVKRIETTKKGHKKFIADSNSSWYMINDATSTIKKLKTMDLYGNTKPFLINQTSIGRNLQSIRQIKNHEELDKHEQKISSAKYDFISYRIKDGSKMAFQKVVELIKKGTVVFWDRYSLPRRLAERREFVSDEKLDKYLIDKLKKAKSVWGIESKQYAVKNSYSLKEYEIAKATKKYISVKRS